MAFSETNNQPWYMLGQTNGGDLRSAQIANINAQTKMYNQHMKQSQFGFNANTFGNVMGGLNSLGQLWGAWQAQKLAKDQWKTQKNVLNTNMMNQIQSYNNQLRDKLDTRAHMEGRSQESADQQYEERKARRA